MVSRISFQSLYVRFSSEIYSARVSGQTEVATAQVLLTRNVLRRLFSP